MPWREAPLLLPSIPLALHLLLPPILLHPLQFVVKAVSHAMARDASSGGCIRTVTIDAAGARRDFINGSNVPVTYGELAAPK